MPKVWNKRDPSTPKDAIYVGRPSKWGNPFKIGVDGDRRVVVELYKLHLAEIVRNEGQQALAELRGKDLVCWCAPLPCHADVLLEIANA